MLSKASIVLLGLISSSLALNQYPGPEPTTPPNAHELLRRQSSSASSLESDSSSSSSSSTVSESRTLLAGPDSVCGYLGGQPDRPYGCATGNCFLATTTPILVTISVAGSSSTATVAGNPTPGSILCCDPKTGCPSVPAPTACVDRRNFPTSSAASGSATSAAASSGSGSSSPTSVESVSSDSMTLTCTSGLYVFCNTLTFADPYISAHFCNYISNTQVQNATTTYSGQADHAFTPTQPVFAVTYTPPPPSTAVPSSSATAASVTPTATASPKKKSNKGAIIGGVVGGVLGLLLIVGAVIMFIRWRNSGLDEEDEAEGTETPVSEVHKPVPAPVAAPTPAPAKRTTRIVERRR